jgi:3-dehydroquinate dehydratase I
MICVSIGEPDFNKCLKLLEKTDCAEIRLDKTEFSKTENEIIFALRKKLIATCRPGKYSDAERSEILKSAITAGACFVDIEYESGNYFREDIISFAHQKQCDVIISYHNFEFTPEIEELEKIMRESFEIGADLVKIATMVKVNRDNSKILSLYHAPGRIVALGMGELGKISRVVAPFLGAEFTYASADEGEPTAPGQISYSRLNDFILKIQEI